MQDNVADFAGPLTVSKFKGGQSNPTYRLDTPSTAYVLRRKPYGELLPSAHAVDREYFIIDHLNRAGFVTPRAYGLCQDDSVIGSWFYVMAMVEGRTIWDAAMDGSTPAERRAVTFEMVDVLARLHNIDCEQAGVGAYGKPGNYFERQIARWTKQYRASETERLEPMERLIDYLARTIPEQTRISVVHGDYRNDNLIFAKDRPKILAVLDWELSTIGDPLADFTYFCMAWVTENGGRSGVADLDRAALGIPELDEVVARYCAATDRDGVPDMNWYQAYNHFRLAGILQGIKKRVQIGTASSAHAKDMSARVEPLAARAWEFAQKAGA
ncbi:phosphotransferase family protein [Sphingomonas antarctica]|uniref:phosphotransferase family protein n=1 Tax=Sphingomonas antarctica TaxID=2040274 RepID=UPI0039E79CC1